MPVELCEGLCGAQFSLLPTLSSQQPHQAACLPSVTVGVWGERGLRLSDPYPHTRPSQPHGRSASHHRV